MCQNTIRGCLSLTLCLCTQKLGLKQAQNLIDFGIHNKDLTFVTHNTSLHMQWDALKGYWARRLSSRCSEQSREKPRSMHHYGGCNNRALTPVSISICLHQFRGLCNSLFHMQINLTKWVKFIQTMSTGLQPSPYLEVKNLNRSRQELPGPETSRNHE